MRMLHGMKCYGSTVIGEKGQIVIPAEVRKTFGVRAGDKFMVLAGKRHLAWGIILVDAEVLSKVVREMFGEEVLSKVVEEMLGDGSKGSGGASSTKKVRTQTRGRSR